MYIASNGILTYLHRLKKDEDPVIVDDSVTISDTKTSQPIFTIDVTDADTTDLVAVTSGFSVMKTAGSSLFSVVKTATGYDIRSGASLSAGSYPLNITATDRCGDTATGTITVTVTNTAPVFVPVSLLTVHPTPISDVTTTARSLYAFDATDSNPITCTVDNTKFEIKTLGSAYGLWLKAESASTLNHDVTAVESMTITCSDGTDQITSSYKVDISDAAPQDSFFNVVPGTAPTFAIWVKAGVKLDAATSPFLVNVQCVDDRSPANIITETFTVPLLDKPPTFVTGIPGTSPSISDSTVTSTSLGVFTVTDPDTTCSITSSLTSVYEIRPVTSPADLQKPEFQVWVSAAVTQASIDFNDQAVPLPLTITCTDGNTAITGTFNVNIIDEPPVISVLPAIGTAINDGLQTVATILQHVQRDRQR
ncbi:serine-rich adhesin for platelets-like [Dreissena polymorpha]|uniref:serine-rich adhesin for platelets-like n=1 Tax=Dreissena polymorpha TaxID=45954 RepID=UPI0022645632|nr:serine-rich adhesin for platelets-like [Dreissena polymorpha]